MNGCMKLLKIFREHVKMNLQAGGLQIRWKLENLLVFSLLIFITYSLFIFKKYI